jgi:hypothetical protein
VFKAIGLLLAAYTLFAVLRGEVVAKSGPWGRVIQREHTPKSFWTVIAIYTGLAAALLTVF